jgi:hypothetical protein
MLAAQGCGADAGRDGSKDVSHVRVITALYFTATSALGRSPESEEEFKGQIAKASPDLSVLGVGSIDELFVSDRDGQPLVVLYGKQRAGAAPDVVAYEQTGKDGVRLIGNKSGQVEEADDARFSKLVETPTR